MTKSQITKLAFKWHGWLGITAGIFFLLFGITGSMLMFRTDLDRYCNPELHHVQPSATIVSADSIYRQLVRTHPNLKKIVLHDFPSDKYDTYEFMLYKNQQHVTDNYLYFVFVDPYTGKVLSEGSYGNLGPSFFRWLYSFHYSLQLGMPGMLFTALIGLVMLLSLVTGIIIYRKHFWDALRFRAGLRFKNTGSAISSLHRIVGVWAIISTAILFITGFWMNKEHFSAKTWQLQKPHSNHLVKANIDDLVKRSLQIAPGFKPIAVNIPCVTGQEILVRGQMPDTRFCLLKGKASAVTFDPQTGAFKKVIDIDKQNYDKRIDTEIYNLHIGSYGGNAVRWLYVFFGLLPGILSVTGALLWLKKRRRRYRTKVNG
ncbi:PepSY-associated TM helix domain-containing protein [Mucilaginibacter ginkgonis]|uniref:PepSY domain-containing protein n=1 Tax=Mucilaginibacter ginkgonis TaxID=2682091 RepID=A0A6I4HYL8_9SPHI|nr:PepSY-associated TM helix domain-containing protein [Mucilaginibacter ginkgonis]QQL49601.1 PepSY domain-containing protein [Mucilaginibacter ginkgonis]